MFDLFAVQSSVMFVISLVLFAVKAFAFVDAVTRTPAMFLAADKQTKQFWLIVLGLSVVANMLFWAPIGILNLAGTVAALVYLADARPAMQSITKRR